MSFTNFLDNLKIKPLITNENENGIKILIPKQLVEGVKTKEEGKKTAQMLRELIDEGDKAIDIANKIKQQRLTGIKKTIRPPEPSIKKIMKPTILERESGQPEELFETEISRKKERTKKASIFQSIPTNAVYNLINKDLIVGSKKLIDRIPLPPEDFIKIPNYVMNNRLSFIRFANQTLFSEYKEQLESETGKSNITCADLTSGSSNSGLMIHQQLVRDYLNLVTPYRGLLLYHGLGSGKTCSSIAIAEGMKDKKRVIVMLPASLQRNYIEEIKKCGDPIFKRNQFWEWVPVSNDNEELINNLSMVLSLSPDYISKQRGAWITDISRSSNIVALNSEQLKSLNLQLDTMIKNKYQFINYNGLRKERFRIMTENYTKNIFDDSVVIIDEAHNLISRIVNKISALRVLDDKKSKRKFQQESINRGIETSQELSLQIYHMLMMAVNCKIVLLTGTPMINYPNEIGILFNILRGYIKSWIFNLRPAPETNTLINEDMLKNIVFSKDKILDYVQYTPTSQRLTITRNPFGFESVIKERDRINTYEGVSNLPAKKKDERGNTIFKERKLITDNEFQEKIIKLLRDNKISATLEEIKYNLALPDKLDDFLMNFVDVNKPDKMKNEMKFKKRIMGLTSYFRSAQEELLPRYDKRIDKHIVKVKMSNFQFNIYLDYRKKERQDEKKKRGENKPNEIFKQQTSTYRIMSRLGCNLTLPNRPNPIDYRKKKIVEQEEPEETQQPKELVPAVEMKEPEPEQEEEISFKRKPKVKKAVQFAEKNEVKEITPSEPTTTKTKTKTPTSASSKKSLNQMIDETMPELNSDKKDLIVRSIREFESSDFGKSYTFERIPENSQSRMVKEYKGFSDKLEKDNSLSFSNYFEKRLKSSKKGGSLLKLLMIGGLNSDDGEEEEEEFATRETTDENRTEDDIIIEEPELGDIEQEIENMTTDNYKIDIANFMRNLKNNATKFLSMTPIDDELPPLMNYSPKYVEIIKNLTSDDHVGLHLLYSQFRNMEGLDIFSIALNVNGFKRFRLVKDATGKYEVSRDALEGDEWCYAMYTGEEDSDERELIRKIYNGDWNDIPQNIREQLQTKSPNNNLGEIIKLLMITSAGAEGINLKNTRYVHIMEPYWHPVRVEQVIGRARRICSHDKLPRELHTVDVFVYISVFTPEQLDTEYANEINRYDKSNVAPFAPETSDEKLLSTSNIKETISEVILKSIKETSIDCATYSEANEGKEGLKCLSFNSAKIEEFSYVPEYDEQQQDVDIPLGQIRRNVEFKKITIRDGTEYMLKVDTNELYDPIDVQQANPTPIGKLTAIYTIDEDGKQIPSGKTTIQFYKQKSVIDETAR
jgi:hypothetical protein